MLYFLENHDEQRIASDFFAADPQKGLPAMMVASWLNASPVMVYAGQEFGEKGMDQEGFSGMDGRTTIFDYWSVDTIRRGYFDSRKMKKAERELRDSYSKILSLANAEDALREGDTYDLMYVNHGLAERQFAFLRKQGRQMVLVVVNFSDVVAECDVVLPQHVFEFWNMKGGSYRASDLLTGETLQMTIGPDMPVSVSIPAWGGRAYKFIL